MLSMIQQVRKATYEAAVLAESMWEEELYRIYGKDHIDARYDSKRNRATPMLKALYELRINAHDAWIKGGQIQRNEIAA